MNNEENENIIDTTNVDTNEDLVTHEEIVDDNIKEIATATGGVLWDIIIHMVILQFMKQW